MSDFLTTMNEFPLFRGIAPDDIQKVLKCVSLKRVSYKKGDIILRAGDRVDDIGFLIDGCLSAFDEDINGKINITESHFAPTMLGEIVNGAELDCSPTSILATQNCEILTVSYKKLLHPCPSKCEIHLQIMRNLLFSTATKALMLYDKTKLLTKPTIREKIVLFLNISSKRNGGRKKFTIPYNRNELAQYLCVNQSALSNELRKMQDEGLIRFKLNRFELL